MIIISQERDTIINFDIIYCIWLEKPCITQYDEKDKYFRIFIQSDGCSNLIGYYKTEERAKEVLEEFISFYRSADQPEDMYAADDAMAQIMIRDKAAFYMPLE